MSARLIAIAAGGLLVGGIVVGVALWSSDAGDGRDPSPASATKPPAPAPPPATRSSRSPETPRGPAAAGGARGATPAPTTPAPAAAPAPTTGTLRITSDVPGASVFIDRVYLGTTPLTADNVAPGTHRLNVSVEGYEGIAESIEVTPGPRDIEIKFKEVRLDAAIDLVHKHGAGSCRGTLHATPRGLSFAASDAGDRFDVPLTSIETFEVDYLEKNLRVKIRGGRTYNFTDPEGNADRLFVFHRDVDKVRKRMIDGR